MTRDEAAEALREYIRERDAARAEYEARRRQAEEDGFPFYEAFEFEPDDTHEGAFSDDPDVNRYYETGDEND